MEEGVDFYFVGLFTLHVYILFNLVLRMQARQIRDKYKRILEQPEEQDSDDEWEIAYSNMTKQRKKKILTESNVNIPPNGQFSEPSQGMLALKQKLAQCLSNCKSHCKEIEQLKKSQLLFNEERTQWKQEQNQFHKMIDNQKDNVRAREERIKELENQRKELMANCQELAVEKDLQHKQAEFYKAELAHLKVELERKERQFKNCEKDFRTFEKIKKDNEHLKIDVERLGSIVEDSMRLGKVRGELMKKHFLGKPHREMDFWYPQQLVGEVQHFLKKAQVGHGNKEFTTNLIKFIDKLIEKSKEQPKVRQVTCSSKPKDRQSYSLKRSNKLYTIDYSSKKSSYNLNSLRDEHINLRASTGVFWKGNESRLTNSGVHAVHPSLAVIKSNCWDIVNEFRDIVFELLLQKEVKRKKIKKLIDSMSGSLMEMFQSHSNQYNEFSFAGDRNDFGHMRLVTDEATAPLK